MKRPVFESEKRASLLHQLDSSIHEGARVAGVAKDASVIYDMFSREFSEKTGFTKLDWGFLFTATALQMLRQYLLTAFQDRLGDQEAAAKVEGKDKISEDKEYRRDNPRKHRYYNPGLEEIIGQPVPFDANVGANGALKGGGAFGHRGATPGHDPIVGLVVGSANIATSTLTNWTFDSWHIKSRERMNGGVQDAFCEHADTFRVFAEFGDKLFHQGWEGRAKVAASVGKEILHLRTDVNTKKGLPIPVVGTLSPRMASWLAGYGIDFANTVNVLRQATLAKIINVVIAMMHGLFYDEENDGSMDLYKVRTRKIIIYSNAIAATTNALFVWCTEQYKFLDLGGYAVALYELVTGVDFIERVRKDFIVGKFDYLINQEG